MGRADRNRETQEKVEEMRRQRAVESQERRLIDPATVSPGELPPHAVDYQMWRLLFSIRNMIIAWWVVTIVAAVVVAVAVSNANS